MSLLLLSLRLALGSIFLMSAIPKMAAPRQFANDVHQYRLLPRPLGSAFGYVLPYVELAAALMLMAGVYASWAALLVVVMLASFMVAVGTAMVRKLNLNCSCFGLLYRERVGWPTQIRDGILLVVALFIVFGESGDLALTNMLAEPDRLSNALGLAATTLTLGLGIVVAFLSIRFARR